MKIPWLEPFRAAVAREVGRPPILSLATVNESGDPEVRSVVCRRVDDDGNLWITSDARSAKHRELARNPRAAAVAWFPRAREQYRFNGSISALDEASRFSIRAELWRSLSASTKATFFWPDPGGPRREADAAFAESSEAADPPAAFAVLVLSPTSAERLLLMVHPHRRTRWERDGEWSTLELNP